VIDTDPKVARERVDITAVIDGAKISPLQMRVFGLCFFVALLDGFDTQSIAFVAPSIVKAWGLSAASFGPVFAAGLFGTAVGSLALGRLADRFGRKKLMLVSLAIFGVFTLACATAEHSTSLLLSRFFAGIGLGGALPNLMAPAAEYAPQRKRSSIVVTIMWGFPLGAILGGLLSTALIARFGWQAVFYLGGALPLLALPLFIGFLPESIRFLALRPDAGAALAGILSRIDRTRSFDPAAAYSLPELAPQPGSMRALFSPELIAGTILLSTAFFTSLLLSYLLVNWIPLLLQAEGIPVANAVIGTVVLNFSGIVGSYLISKRMDASQRRLPWIATGYILSALAVACIGLAGARLPWIMVGICATGFLLIGAQMSLGAFVASFYPTAVRGTGIGWTQAVGRVGSLFGPLIGGLLLSLGASPAQLFALGSIPALLTASALLLLIACGRDDSPDPGRAVPISRR